MFRRRKSSLRRGEREAKITRGSALPVPFKVVYSYACMLGRRRVARTVASRPSLVRLSPIMPGLPSLCRGAPHAPRPRLGTQDLTAPGFWRAGRIKAHPDRDQHSLTRGSWAARVALSFAAVRWCRNPRNHATRGRGAVQAFIWKCASEQQGSDQAGSVPACAGPDPMIAGHTFLQPGWASPAGRGRTSGAREVDTASHIPVHKAAGKVNRASW
jgi:hypothetical protein